MLTAGLWGVPGSAQLRTKLLPGDGLIIAVGSPHREFIGDAVLGSRYRPFSDDELAVLPAGLEFDHGVTLTRARLAGLDPDRGDLGAGHSGDQQPKSSRPGSDQHRPEPRRRDHRCGRHRTNGSRRRRRSRVRQYRCGRRRGCQDHRCDERSPSREGEATADPRAASTGDREPASREAQVAPSTIASIVGLPFRSRSPRRRSALVAGLGAMSARATVSNRSGGAALAIASATWSGRRLRSVGAGVVDALDARELRSACVAGLVRVASLAW
jgi:hypothetical protein